MKLLKQESLLLLVWVIEQEVKNLDLLNETSEKDFKKKGPISTVMDKNLTCRGRCSHIEPGVNICELLHSK